MEAVNELYFFLGAAEKELDLGILFHKIDGADDCDRFTYGQGTAPNVDSVPIHGGGVFDITVIDLVYEGWEFRVCTAFRSVDHDFSGGYQRVDRLPEIIIISLKHCRNLHYSVIQNLFKSSFSFGLCIVYS